MAFDHAYLIAPCGCAATFAGATGDLARVARELAGAALVLVVAGVVAPRAWRHRRGPRS